jgi:hypothetical protein
MFDHRDICELARTLGCKIDDLVALAPHNDPFYAERNSRRKEAEWFAQTCRSLGLSYGIHVRRVHYRASISPPVPILKPDGTPYTNTHNDWMLMARASRDARYLRLVPGDWFVDRRNPEPIIHAKFREWRTDPHIDIEHAEGFGGSIYWLPDEPRLPELSLEGFIPSNATSSSCGSRRRPSTTSSSLWPDAMA